MDMYAMARFSSSMPRKGADVVIPIAMAVAILKFAQEYNGRGHRLGSRTHIAIVPPNTSGEYAIPESMRYPE